MALPLSLLSHCQYFVSSSFLLSTPIPFKSPGNKLLTTNDKNWSRNHRSCSISCCASRKIVPSPRLDKHATTQNNIRFLLKLRTLLLSKPKHFIPLHILSKCRSYLCLSDSRSIISMIRRYPSIFELFNIPTPPSPINATRPYYQQCVRLTPAAEAHAAQESNLQSTISVNLATKLQKLLMLSSHRRLLLSKLVHLAPDLGLPANFRSRLCNDFPDKFKIVDTSYGRALELVSWDMQLGVPLPVPDVSLGLIVDRPLKFKRLRLRKGLNLKRSHQDFLIKFGELPDVCPYNTSIEDFAKESIEAEKRACAVVREVLGMTVEKRTLIDHLTHFRKEFGLPNKLRGMIVRHPELFYVSLKGQRDSVFLTEAYDDKGVLLEKDKISVMKDQLMELVRKSKRMRRERRKGTMSSNNIENSNDEDNHEFDDFDADVNNYDDGFENVFETEDPSMDYEFNNDSNEFEFVDLEDKTDFWSADGSSLAKDRLVGSREPW